MLEVLQALEEARVAKQIGSSLEARLEISAAGESYDLLTRYQEDLRYVFIVSQVEVIRSDEGATGVVVKVLPAEGAKCERCWNYSTHVGESARYPEVCERCVKALEEIEQEPRRYGDEDGTALSPHTNSLNVIYYGLYHILTTLFVIDERLNVRQHTFQEGLEVGRKGLHPTVNAVEDRVVDCAFA